MIEDHCLPLYLAGPISGLTYKQANEDRASKHVVDGLKVAGWVGLNPLEGYESLDNGLPLHAWFEDAVEGSTPEHGVHTDLRMIDTSAAVFANYQHGPKPSLGTAAEIGYAFGKGKPIVSLLDKTSENYHPFIVHLSTVVVDSWDEALEELAVLRQTLQPVPYA